MDVETAVADHYTTGALLSRIEAALRTIGVDPAHVRTPDLEPVDEFHIGGAEATRELVGALAITREMAVLDIGAGLGGPARLVADATGAHVTGVDLTPEFVETAKALSTMVGLSDQTQFEVGSALDLPFADATFDVALLLHVGMNIPDKARLMAEAFRVLKPGGLFAVYDVMKTNGEPIDFPVPWADEPENSFLARLEDYRHAAATAGFVEVAARDRTEIALAFFADQRARAERDGPPTLGVNLLLGESGPQKLKNMVANITAGRIGPTELILRRP